ncbi:hypothetical protein [Mycolicibacterium sp.]|uniref:hypothetical protein n=1 Tax=Mycolicibacterium sp. TaxID=2320850 RepID=UPI00355DBB7F
MTAVPLQGALDASTLMETATSGGGFAAAEAVGIFIDDPDDPHVAVVVREGRIVYIGISDPMLRRSLDELQDMLNAGIFTAFSMWQAQLRAAP